MTGRIRNWEADISQITRPTPEAMAAMSERVAPVVKEYSEKIGVELVERARADMAAVAN